MEKQTGSKSGKAYVKAVYCYAAYLTYMQSTSWEMLGDIGYKKRYSLSCVLGDNRGGIFSKMLSLYPGRILFIESFVLMYIFHFFFFKLKFFRDDQDIYSHPSNIYKYNIWSLMLIAAILLNLKCFLFITLVLSWIRYQGLPINRGLSKAYFSYSLRSPFLYEVAVLSILLSTVTLFHDMYLFGK